MAALVMVRYKPTGEVRAVDPDKWDVPGQLATGNFEMAGTSDFAHVPPGGTPGAGVPRKVTADVAPGLSGRAAMADLGKRVLREDVPSIAAATASLLAPESLVLPGVARTVAPWLLRTGAAGLAGTGATLGAQGLTGQPINVGDAVTRGTGEAAAQLLGEGAAGVANNVAEGLYRGALRPGAKLTKQAANTASRIAGRAVQADEASLASQGLRDRIPIGRGFTGTGVDKLATINAPHNAAISEALAAATQAGHTTNIMNLMDELTVLRGELANETNGAKKLAALDKMQKAMIDQFRLPSSGRGPGKLVRFTPEKLQELKSTWQHQAETFYNQSQNGVPSERAALQARVDEAMARAARKRLEGISIPSSQPGRTLGDILANANEQLASRKALGTAVGNAETGIAAGTRGSSIPLWAHAGAPAAGALGGAILGHGAEGAAAGAALGLGADRLASNPISASRIALFLTNPVVRKITQTSPHSLIPLLQMLSSPAPPDQTQQGGTQ